MTEAERVVRAFLDSWQDRNVEAIMAFFAPGAVYHNMPVAPCEGAAAIRTIFEAFVTAFDEAELRLINLAVAGDIVFTERVDYFSLGDRRVVLPVNGVFEVRDGLIHAFRDYFDLATFESQSGLKL